MENLRKKFIICKTITTDDYDLGWNIFNHICNNPEAVKEFNDHSAFDNYNIAKKAIGLLHLDVENCIFMKLMIALYVK